MSTRKPRDFWIEKAVSFKLGSNGKATIEANGYKIEALSPVDLAIIAKWCKRTLRWYQSRKIWEKQK